MKKLKKKICSVVCLSYFHQICVQAIAQATAMSILVQKKGEILNTQLGKNNKSTDVDLLKWCPGKQTVCYPKQWLGGLLQINQPTEQITAIDRQTAGGLQMPRTGPALCVKFSLSCNCGTLNPLKQQGIVPTHMSCCQTCEMTQPITLSKRILLALKGK